MPESPASSSLVGNRVWLLRIGVVLAAVLPILTLRRVPTPFPDVQLYASIALARQIYGVGVPTISWNSPVAVDHIPFYGPVFFDICAAGLHVLGLSLLSFRVVSLLGAALFLGGTLMLARQFAGSRERVLVAAFLVLLSPEMNFAASAGAMHSLAVGFELLAMSAFVVRFDRRRGGAIYGIAAGVFLALAALTTPRSYFFVLGFCCAGLVPSFFGTARLAVRYRFGFALATLAAIMVAWATVSHGSVIAWARYLWFIFTHEDTDVAILPTAVRQWSFHWSSVPTLLVAVVGGLAASRALGRWRAGDEARRGALTFLVIAAWIELVTTSVVLNYTFTLGEYIALPLFALVVSWPDEHPLASPRTMRVLLAIVMTTDLLVFGYRYAAVFATWEARSPDPLNAFVARHVPAGSTVVGPEAPYFFPVERNGSRYRTVSPRSWADWARWVPEIEPQALLVPRRIHETPPGDRFLIGIKDDDLPDGYACAAGHLVATYIAPAVNPQLPGWIRRIAEIYPGYPSTSLYKLPPGCPTGYDPTRRPQ